MTEHVLPGTLTLARLDGEYLVVIVAIGCGVGAIAIVGGVIHSMFKIRQRERSRREIAAYVAEGSMTPDDAEKILKAEPDSED